MSSEAPLMLSVSGARGIVGRTMTPSVAAEYAAACGSFIKGRSKHASPLVMIGRDSRPSGEMLLQAAAAGLLSVGCRVIDLGVTATPTVAVMIDKHRAHGGLVITASHNPTPWNGIKCLDGDGVAPPAEHVEEIIRRFRERDYGYVDATAIYPLERDLAGDETHVNRVLAAIDPRPITQKGYRVVLDSVNGAGCRAGRMLLEALGCHVEHLNDEPTGRFAHEPEPLAENLTDLARRTAECHAACGFAQDPDADRLAIIDENGRYIGEEYTLVLAAREVLAQRAGSSASPIVIAANLSTSRMIDDLAAQHGATVVRTAVGEANVVAALKPKDGAIGGEGNGGVIYPPVCWVRDSLSAMALVLALLARGDLPLSAIVDEMPSYAMVKQKMDLAGLGGREAVGTMIQRVLDAFAGQQLNTADGVRIDFESGWVHLRPSNTEPIVRLIGEAPTEKAARELMDRVARAAGLAPVSAEV